MVAAKTGTGKGLAAGMGWIAMLELNGAHAGARGEGDIGHECGGPGHPPATPGAMIPSATQRSKRSRAASTNSGLLM